MYDETLHAGTITHKLHSGILGLSILTNLSCGAKVAEHSSFNYLAMSRVAQYLQVII